MVWSLVSSLCFSLRSPVKRLQSESRVKKSLFLMGASVFSFRLYIPFGGFLVAVGYAASLVGGAPLSLHHLLWCPLILSSPAAATAPWWAGTSDTINMTDCWTKQKFILNMMILVFWNTHGLLVPWPGPCRCSMLLVPSLSVLILLSHSSESNVCTQENEVSSVWVRAAACAASTHESCILYQTTLEKKALMRTLFIHHSGLLKLKSNLSRCRRALCLTNHSSPEQPHHDKGRDLKVRSRYDLK